MNIKHETWLKCRTDYLTGKGSLRTLAVKHGLNLGSVEKHARKERWRALRSEFEAAQLAKLLPPAPRELPPMPIAPDGAVSDEWMRVRMEVYYRRNAELLDKARTLLEMKLGDATSHGTDGLAKLTSALGGIVDAEGKLLGLNNRRKEKRRPPPVLYMPPSPIEEPTSISSAGDEDENASQ